MFETPKSKVSAVHLPKGQEPKSNVKSRADLEAENAALKAEVQTLKGVTEGLWQEHEATGKVRQELLQLLLELPNAPLLPPWARKQVENVVLAMRDQSPIFEANGNQKAPRPTSGKTTPDQETSPEGGGAESS